LIVEDFLEADEGLWVVERVVFELVDYQRFAVRPGLFACEGRGGCITNIVREEAYRDCRMGIHDEGGENKEK
jgi:hypothetical protein